MNIRNHDMDRVPSAYLHGAEKLAKNGFAMFPSQTNLDQLVLGVMRCYRTFLTEPEGYRNSWNFWAPSEYGSDKVDLGYQEKNGEKPGEDAKHILHWGIELELKLQGNNVDASRHQYLLGYSRTIFNICWTEHRAILEALDHVVPGFHFYERTQNEFPRKQSRLRLVSYKDILGRKIMADGHYDLGVLTQHLHSGPGLYLGKNETRARYFNSQGYTLVFFGKKMETITDGQLKAVWHEVIDERPKGETRPREAAVFFGHTA